MPSYAPLEVVWSGGQTGADLGWLAAGAELGLVTGGWAPYRWMTEAGPKEALLRGYGLKECTIPGYLPRTLRNLRQTDGTVIFGDIREPGSRRTKEQCELEGKPFLVNPSATELAYWITRFGLRRVNGAGNRASINPEIESVAYNTLMAAAERLKVV